jgi:hypothetical protein
VFYSLTWVKKAMHFQPLHKKSSMTAITNDFDYQMAERELKALMQQSPSINAVRIAEIQLAINAYLLKK